MVFGREKILLEKFMDGPTAFTMYALRQYKEKPAPSYVALQPVKTIEQVFALRHLEITV